MQTDCLYRSKTGMSFLSSSVQWRDDTQLIRNVINPEKEICCRDIKLQRIWAPFHIKVPNTAHRKILGIWNNNCPHANATLQCQYLDVSLWFYWAGLQVRKLQKLIRFRELDSSIVIRSPHPYYYPKFIFSFPSCELINCKFFYTQRKGMKLLIPILLKTLQTT